MKSYIFVVECYIWSKVSLSLQWIFESFHLNGLNVDNENNGD